MQLIVSVLVHKALILLFAIIRTDWNPHECREEKLSGKKKKKKKKRTEKVESVEVLLEERKAQMKDFRWFQSHSAHLRFN